MSLVSSYELDTFQLNAIHSIQSGHSVLVSAPTGSGKTVIAEYAVERCLELGKRIIYTAPIKALSNQKFRDFRKLYGNERVGILTGDVSINPDAQIVLMTTEIFRNCIFESPKRLENVLYAIYDEIHFINDESRGTVWEESIIFTPPHIQIICLSATVPNIRELGEWIVSVRHCPLDVIEERKRAVPLVHILYNKYGTLSLEQLLAPEPVWPKKTAYSFSILEHVIEQNHLPALIFAFNRKACERKAFKMKEYSLVSPEEKEKLTDLINSFLKHFDLESLRYTPIVELLRSGIGYHHAGMLPLVKELVERLFNTGLIKMLFTTETFAMGVNMPAFTVVFMELKRWNGQGLSLIKAGSYHQMAGRAGRRGMDAQGYVYAPIDFDRRSYEKVYELITGDIEDITSQFNLSYSTLLSLYLRLGLGLFEACDKSLGIYLKTKNKDAATREAIVEERRKEVRKKLKILQTLFYIDGEKLRNKGLFAVRISGYEIHLAELFFEGVFEGRTLAELAVLLNAIVFEGKRSDWYSNNRYEEQDYAQRSIQLIDHVIDLENLYQIRDFTKRLDFRLASAIEAWVNGCPFEELSKFTSCSPGDFVRTTRMTLQLIRQLVHIVWEHKDFRESLLACARALNRDQVDAEHQLTLDD